MKKVRKKIKYFFLRIFVRLLLLTCRVLPRNWVLAFFKNLSHLAFRWFPKEVQKINTHLDYAYNHQYSDVEKSAFARKVFENIALNAADIFISSKYHTAQALDHIVINHGWEHFENALKKNKGVLILTCHLGAFEFIASNVTLRHIKGNIVAKKLHNPSLNQLLEDFREGHGANMIYSGESAIQIIKAIKRNEVVFMLIDQDIRRSKGVFVDFFGKPAWTPLGAAMVALRTEVPVVPMGVIRQSDGKHLITTLPEIPLERTGDKEKDIIINTQNFNHRLEQLIRMDPTQWVWMHERWKTTPQDIAEDEANTANAS